MQPAVDYGNNGRAAVRVSFFLSFLSVFSFCLFFLTFLSDWVHVGISVFRKQIQRTHGREKSGVIDLGRVTQTRRREREAAPAPTPQRPFRPPRIK